VELAKGQRNEIFETIAVASGLDPQSFTFISVGYPVEIRHESSRSLFEIISKSGQYYEYTMRVGPPGRQDPSSYERASWIGVIGNLARWASEVAYEAMPDLWKELRKVPRVLGAAQTADASNAPFTPDERAEISTRIDQVKDAVERENPELTVEQLSTIEQTLDEVKEGSTRVGRKDWVMLANGALLSLIVNDLVPSHVVQSVFSMLITGIGHLFGVGGPPPVITS
jgi:hypothetical protein